MQKDVEQIHGEIERDNKINCYFGVEYCSAHLFSGKVRVITMHNGDRQYVWDSEAGGPSLRRRMHNKSRARSSATKDQLLL